MTASVLDEWGELRLATRGAGCPRLGWSQCQAKEPTRPHWLLLTQKSRGRVWGPFPALWKAKSKSGAKFLAATGPTRAAILVIQIFLWVLKPSLSHHLRVFAITVLSY